MTNQIYRNQEVADRHVGSPFSGVPIDRDVVEEVANEYDLQSGRLAKALRELDRDHDMLNIDILYSGFDPMPVGKNSNGYLLLTAAAGNCWDVVADRMNLTSIGRTAVAAAHDRHVHKHGQTTCSDAESGFVVTCPEFPEAVIQDVQILVQQTSLSATQATVWMLDQYALSISAITDILSIPETAVRSELKEVEAETERVTAAALLLDSPCSTITRTRPDPNSDRWMGLEWSSWHSLRDRKSLLTELPRAPGFYRVRHTEIQGLLYVGESGSERGIRDRVGHGLAVGLNDTSQPEAGNHDATPSLWRITSEIEGQLQVSFVTPPIAANKRHRLALEAALVAVARREMGRTPWVMLNRDPLQREAQAHRARESSSPQIRNESYSVPTWSGWRKVTSSEWLGFEWSSPRPLADRADIESSQTCAFRVWQPQSETHSWKRTLTVVGTTASLRSRLFTLQNEYGPEAMFSVAELLGLSDDDLSRSRELEEVRYDLIGAHYLATGQPPRDQY